MKATPMISIQRSLHERTAPEPRRKRPVCRDHSACPTKKQLPRMTAPVPHCRAGADRLMTIDEF
jgi:hypothetical protein